jgi:hypothetical protein
VFISALFTIVKLWKQPRCPTTDEWTKKMWYIFTIEFYSHIKNNDNMWLLYTSNQVIDTIGGHNVK